MGKAHMMKGDSKSAQLAVLSAAAEADPDSPDIDLLISNLGLQSSDRAEFLAILRSGYWRKAKSPFNFVRSKVFAAALLGSEGERDRDALGDADAHEGAMEHSQALFGSNRIGLSNELTYDDCAVGFYADHDDKIGPPCGIERVHRSLLEWVPVDPAAGYYFDRKPQVNWQAVGDAMGLDADEIAALKYKSQGLSFWAAARLERNRSRCKELKAAWARVERLFDSGDLQRFLENPGISTGARVATSRLGHH